MHHAHSFLARCVSSSMLKKSKFLGRKRWSQKRVREKFINTFAGKKDNWYKEDKQNIKQGCEGKDTPAPARQLRQKRGPKQRELCGDHLGSSPSTAPVFCRLVAESVAFGSSACARLCFECRVRCAFRVSWAVLETVSTRRLVKRVRSTP